MLLYFFDTSEKLTNLVFVIQCGTRKPDNIYNTSREKQNMRSSHSPTIRSRYDYYYSSMSPASSTANFYDNQNQSLFGDPVPPATDFLETLDNHLYGSLRRSSNVYNHISNQNNNISSSVHQHPGHSNQTHSIAGSHMAGSCNSNYPYNHHLVAASTLSQGHGYPEPVHHPSPLRPGMGADSRHRMTPNRPDHYPLPHSMHHNSFRGGGYLYGSNRSASSAFSEEFRANLDSSR